MIWDVFTYHNEAALLRVRATELAGLEVQAVPVESSTTFSGEPRDRVLPDSHWCELRGSWPVAREDWARHACRDALDARGAARDDWVIFGDVDEIPSATAVLMALNRADSPRTLRMPYHSLLATWRLPLERDRWNHRWPVIGRLRWLDSETGGDWAALRARCGTLPPVENTRDCGGWHLSSMGGPDVVLPKVGAFAHAGEPWAIGLDAERLRDLARRGRDVADRFDQERVPLDRLPWALRDRPEDFRELLEVCW